MTYAEPRQHTRYFSSEHDCRAFCDTIRRAGAHSIHWFCVDVGRFCLTYVG